MGLSEMLFGKKATVKDIEERIQLVQKQEEYFLALEKKNVAEKKAKEVR